MYYDMLIKSGLIIQEGNKQIRMTISDDGGLKITKEMGLYLFIFF